MVCLSTGLEDLKMRRTDLQKIIDKEENEKAALEKNVKVLVDKLTLLNKTITDHIKIRDSYDTTIKETEVGFKKVSSSLQGICDT